MSCGFTNPVGCVTDVIGGATKSVADAAFSAIAHDFGAAAESVVNWLWRQISAATAVSLGGPGFSTELAITAGIAVTVGVGLFVIQVIVSVVRHQPGGLVRAARGLLVAFMAGGAAIAVVNLLLAAVDDLSSGVVQMATGGNIEQLGSKLLAPSALTQVSNAAVTTLLALVMVAASVVVWAALMVRKLLIVVAAIFAPIAFAGSLAEITTAWVRRWIETMVALVFSKLVLVIIFAIGLGVLGGGAGQSNQPGASGATQSLTQTVAGALILVMAGLSPWLAIKLVHFTGDAFHTVHGHAASTVVGAQQVVGAPQRISGLQRHLGSGGPGSDLGNSRPAPSSEGQAPAVKPSAPTQGGAVGPESGLAGGSTSAVAGSVVTAGVAAAAAGAAAAAKAAKAAGQQATEALPPRPQKSPSPPPAKADDPAGRSIHPGP
jgi:hypothetical protein